MRKACIILIGRHEYKKQVRRHSSQMSATCIVTSGFKSADSERRPLVNTVMNVRSNLSSVRRFTPSEKGRICVCVCVYVYIYIYIYIKALLMPLLIPNPNLHPTKGKTFSVGYVG